MSIVNFNIGNDTKICHGMDACYFLSLNKCRWWWYDGAADDDDVYCVII